MVNQLIKYITSAFESIPDPRRNNASYSLSSLLSLSFAMFHLKDSSLLAFRNRFSLRAENLERVYGVSQLPGDTAIRQAIDKVNPKHLQSLFSPLINKLRKAGVIKKYRVLNKYNVVTVDGTGHYCSGKQSCPKCLVKNHRNGTKTYYHQMLSAVLLHPAHAEVFPVATEAIIGQDGYTKNDCELNASKRIIPLIKKVLPNENTILVSDSLYANSPYIELLQGHEMSFIIGAKGLDYLHIKAEHNPYVREKTWTKKGKRCRARYHYNLPLNATHDHIEVHYIEYSEYDLKKRKMTFRSAWITDLLPDDQNIKELIDIARARWKVENETFNTLKNQGYKLEHNYGHGEEYLATNFTILMFLAFLVDQVAQHLNHWFQQAKQRAGSFKRLWEDIRGLFNVAEIRNIEVLYQFIATYSGAERLAIE